MGEAEFGIPRDLVADLARTLDIHAAVETGTFHGNSAVALSEIFDRVWSIEVAEEFWRSAQQRFGDRPGLTFLHGSSHKVLPEVLPTIDESMLFWLDGHWCETAPLTDEPQCPIVEEITTIDAHPHGGQCCILIDDAQLHLAAPPPPYRKEEWPTLLELIDLLRSRHERYITVLNDVIIAGPPQIREVVDGWWLRRHHFPRVYSERDHLRERMEGAMRVPGGLRTKQLVRRLVPERFRRPFQNEPR